MPPATLPERDEAGGLLWFVRLVCMVILSLASTGARSSLAADAGPDDRRETDAAAAPPGRQRPPVPLFVLPKRYVDELTPGESFTLVPAKDGSQDLVAVTPAFTARVSPNGDVRFEDHPLKLSLRPPLPEPVRPGTPTLEGLVRSKLKILPKVSRGFEDRPEYREPQAVIPTPSPYRPDVREECEHPRPCHLELRPLYLNATGNFDAADALELARGRDPNRHEKARFLAETRERRILMAARNHAQDLRRALIELPDTLQAIACDERRTVPERKAILEALEDEMDTSLEQGKTSAIQIRAFLARWQQSRDGGPVCP